MRFSLVGSAKKPIGTLQMKAVNPQHALTMGERMQPNREICRSWRHAACRANEPDSIVNGRDEIVC